MNIHYGLSCDAESLFDAALRQAAASDGCRTVCEIGGGANPVLDADFVRRHRLEYTIVDVSADELAKAPSGYRKVRADITRPDHGIAGPFDLIFSVWCAEHVPDGGAFHRHVFDLLRDGGVALHIFPTLYSLPFVANRLLPESLSERVLRWFQPHRMPEGNHGKFPAYYRWCRGPGRRQIRRLTRIGYEVDRYHGFFGHSGNVAYGSGYLDRLPLLCRLHERMSRSLQRHPNSWLTSMAFVVLRKPAARCVNQTDPTPSGEVPILESEASGCLSCS